jgi:outer membrane receptor protein involved in Fe transport
MWTSGHDGSSAARLSGPGSAIVNRRCRRVALLFLLLPGLLAGQQQDTVPAPVELRTIEVTATPSPRAPADALGISVGAQVVQRAPASNAYDLIRRTAGLEVHEQGQGPGWASDVVLRGFTSDHSSDVLLTIDGVPVNLPIHGHVEGYADWSILSVPAVRGIAVIPGSASPLYGNFAFGGVVAVETARDARGTQVSTGASSHGDAGGWIRSGWRTERSGGMVTLEGRRDQGWRDNSSGWLGNALFRGWRRVGTVRVEGSLAAYGSSWESPGFLAVADYNAGRLERAQDRSDGGRARRYIGRVAFRAPVGAASALEAQAWGQVGRSTVFLNVPEDNVLAQQEERDRRTAGGVQAILSTPTGSGEVSVGVSGRADAGQYDLYATTSRERSDTSQRTEGRYREGGAWLRWQSLPSRRLQLDLALRADVLHFESKDRLDPLGNFRHHTTGLLSPKIGARYQLGDAVMLLGSFSRGFRSAIGVIADPGRPLVTAWSRDAGVEWRGQNAEIRLMAFQSDVRNERIQDPVSLDLTDAGRSRRRGVSVDVGYRPAPRVQLMAEATYNDARITGVAGTGGSSSIAGLRDSEDPPLFPGPRAHHEVPLTPGARVPGVARYFGRVGAEAALSKQLEGRLTSRFSGPFVPIGEPDVETQAYLLFDAGVSLRLSWLGGTLDADLLNLADSRYPEIRASGYINPGRPRTVRIGFRSGVAP